jgi:hypothetical protein
MSDKLYYVIEHEDFSPDTLRSGSKLQNYAEISTVPGRKNLSGEACANGWLGATNDCNRTAHGAYLTLEGAQAKCRALGYTALGYPGEDDMPLENGVVAVYHVAGEEWEARDWLSDFGPKEYGLTRGSSAAEIKACAERLIKEARDPDRNGRGEPVVLLGDVEACLREMVAHSAA